MLKIEITSKQYEVTDDIKKYIYKKIGKLDRMLHKSSKQSAHADVKLKQSKSSDRKQYSCEVVLHLPNENITAHESTLNMFAAVDIVEAKLKNQLKKYKEKRTFGRRRQAVRGVFASLRRKK